MMSSIELRGEAPDSGAQFGVSRAAEVALEQNFWGNILRKIPFWTKIFYSVADRHLTRLYKGGAPHSNVSHPQ